MADLVVSGHSTIGVGHRVERAVAGARKEFLDKFG
jgi:hypothetical protein